MEKIRHRFLAVLALTGTMLLGACASGSQAQALFDLGSLQTKNMTLATPLPAISIADIKAPAWLDSQQMFYRLSYATDQQARPYAGSQWTMPPAQLFLLRLKSRLSQAGGVVVPASDGAANLPVLRIEVDDFSQVFESQNKSNAHIVMRASLFDGRVLRAQKMFIKQLPAHSANAQGGVAALANASDAIIDEIAVWLTTLPSQK